MVSEDPDQTDEYQNTLEAFSSVATIVRRPNISGSYGAWWDGYQIYGNEFDWYFCFEDDYIPFVDNWDDKILEFGVDGVGYIGGLIYESPERHMAVANGAVRAEAFGAANFEDYGVLIGNDKCQIGFSQMIERAGFRLTDYSHRYAVPYWNGADVVDLSSHRNNPLIVPFQYEI